MLLLIAKVAAMVCCWSQQSLPVTTVTVDSTILQLALVKERIYRIREE
jgi:hypothetical protein